MDYKRSCDGLCYEVKNGLDKYSTSELRKEIERRDNLMKERVNEAIEHIRLNFDMVYEVIYDRRNGEPLTISFVIDDRGGVE